MANEKMNGLNPAPVDATAWVDFIDQFEQAKVGDVGISLTEWEDGNDIRPQVNAGSYIEISGGLYQFGALTPIVDDPGGLLAGTIWLRFEPSGDDANPRFVNEAPVWNPNKQGWYDSSELYRYSGHRMEWDGGTVYTDKWYFQHKEVGGSGLVSNPNGAVQAVKGFQTDNIALRTKVIYTTRAAADSGVSHGLNDNDIVFIGAAIRFSGNGEWQSIGGRQQSGSNFPTYIIWNRVAGQVQVQNVSTAYDQVRILIFYAG